MWRMKWTVSYLQSNLLYKMLLVVLILTTSATGAYSNVRYNDFTSRLADATKVLVFGGPVDDVVQRLLYEVNNFRDGITNYLENNPLDQNSTEQLEQATESIASGIEIILQELHIFETFPEMGGSQISITMRIVLLEIVKNLVQLRGIQQAVFNV